MNNDKHTIESILKTMLGTVKTIDIEIFNIWGDDTVLTRYGNPYLLIYVDYFDLKNKKFLCKKTTGFQYTEALLILDMEIGRRYRVTCERINGFWHWTDMQYLEVDKK